MTAGDALSTLIGLLLSGFFASVAFKQSKEEWENGLGIFLVYILFGVINLVIFGTILLDLFQLI